jgi:PAS domain S-box-containing protein
MFLKSLGKEIHIEQDQQEQSRRYQIPPNASGADPRRDGPGAGCFTFDGESLGDRQKLPIQIGSPVALGPDGTSAKEESLTNERQIPAQDTIPSANKGVTVKNADQLLESIIEFLPDATFVIDRHKRIVAWNRACEAMTGVKKESLLGKGDNAYSEPFFGDRRPILIDLLDEPSPDVESNYKYVHRKDGVIFAESFVPSMRGGQGAHLWGQAVSLYDKEGVRCGAIEVIRDITERKRMEEALVASEKEYRELVMLANSIILRWSRDGRITFLNEFGQRFFGYSKDEILGRHVLGTIVPDSESTGRDLRSLMEDICADPKKFERSTNENIRRNGERVWIDWTNKVVLDEQGQIREILSIGSDITERKQTEQELERYREHLEEQVKERTRELADAKERAESADRMKSAFLAAMSHELRTPLNSVIGFTGILLQQIPGSLNKEQQKQLGMVQKSARHLLSLINDVLDISKIEAGQLTVEKESFDVRESAETVMSSVRQLARDKDLSVVSDLSSDLGEITGDRRRYEQVLLNLLSNAIKFTNTGTVSLLIRPTKDGMVESVVRDTGIGINPSEQEAVFQPFHQVENGTSRRHDGTGLGLSISHRLVGMMGGKIWLTSALGKGSTFGFTVPRGGERES